ncbi:MAG: hypothetical protein KAH38_12210, partial [Candidatus Hydrogenedentes bacterium]|nr:hypothetical protein [Candidatus Hydrogenedentota bacterium]
MRILFFSLCIILIIFSGCGNLPQKDTPAPPEPVGPQTKSEVYARISPAINPLQSALAPTSPGISDFEREQVMVTLRNAIVTYGSLSFGQEALRDLGYTIMEIAQKAGTVNRYRLVLVCIDAIELLSMESHLLNR